MKTPLPEHVPSFHRGSLERLTEYLNRSGQELRAALGWGTEGLVYSTTSKSAIKIYRHQELYENERNVYFRIRDRELRSVEGFQIPMLLNWSDADWCVEMSIVSPPFVLDFAGAYLDKTPTFDEAIWEEWEAEKIEQFGAERWDTICSIMAVFRKHGIHLNDVKPGNVTFAG